VVNVPQHFYHVLSDAYHVVIMWVSDVSKKYSDVFLMFLDVKKSQMLSVQER